VASAGARDYLVGMDAQPNIVEQWRYLRGLLIEQLEAFANGGLQIRSNDVNVSDHAIAKLKASIAEFDKLIAAQASSED